MDRADCCRRAARDAVADVEPPRLHDLLVETIDAASMTPGVLTLESAARGDPELDPDSISHRAAGVQLIYEGLALTRTLAQHEPWTDTDSAAPVHQSADANASETPDERPLAPTEPAIDADLEILAADILVARGFYLLARTEAADRAVETVRSFGRDQTLREESGTDAATLDATLERDVLSLAVHTGATAVDASPDAALIALANDVVSEVGVGFPPAEQCLTLTTPGSTDPGPYDGPPTDRATSATDP